MLVCRSRTGAVDLTAALGGHVGRVEDRPPEPGEAGQIDGATASLRELRGDRP
jgi:hypothetical protein